MPVDDLGKLGMRMRAARNEMGLTQQRLSDMCHVSIREITKIENGEMNPSFLILKAIIQVLHNSLDSLIISDGSADEGAEQMKMLYLSCPPEMQETLLNMILSRLVDTFISRISLTMLPVPNPHNTACVLSWEEARHWQSRSSDYSSS